MGNSARTQNGRRASEQGVMVAAAVVSAVFYGISVPLSKMLMDDVSSSLMSALLYLGAGAGMAPLVAARVLAAKRAARDAAPGVASNGAAPGSTTGSATSGNASGAAHEAPAGTAPRAHAPAADTSLTRKEIPLLIVMVAVNAASALLMMYGISNASAANASLLGNFEIAATAVIATLLFKEDMGRRLACAIAVITLSCALLSFEGADALTLSTGSLPILGACVLWGLENNITKALSDKDPLQLTCVKGLGSGACALAVAAALGQMDASLGACALALLLGFASYGLSIALYVRAQRTLGATRTGNYYACAPFAGVAFSWLFFGFNLTWQFALGLALMLWGFWLTLSTSHNHEHTHPALRHEHMHAHDDGHHFHAHPGLDPHVAHAHPHEHAALTHAHEHTPDIHHTHAHR